MNYQRQRAAFLVSEMDYRDPKSPLEDIETGRFLDALDKLPGLTRMMSESPDIFVELTYDSHGHVYPWKVIMRRDPEKLQGSDPDDEPEVNPEDAMAPGRYQQLSAQAAILTGAEDHADEDETEANPDDPSLVQEAWRAPRDRWDLVYEIQTQPDGTRDCFSAPWFPPVAKKNQGPTLFYSLVQRIHNRTLPLVSGSFIYGQVPKLPSSRLRARIWELWYIERAARLGASSLAGKTVRHLPDWMMKTRRRKLSIEQREALINRRAHEIQKSHIEEDGVTLHLDSNNTEDLPNQLLLESDEVTEILDENERP